MKKTIKTALPLLLSVILVCLSVTCAFAQDFADMEKEKLEQSFRNYLTGCGYDFESFPDYTKDPDFYFCRFVTYSKGYAICMGSDGLVPSPMGDYLFIDNYMLEIGNYFQPYPPCIYAIKDNEVLTLEDAYLKGVINLDDLIPHFPLSIAGDTSQCYKIGDVDLDGIVEVEDVLTVQKHIAKMINIKMLGYNSFKLVDIDHNNKLTLSDVLKVQRIIAGEHLQQVWRPGIR